MKLYTEEQVRNSLNEFIPNDATSVIIDSLAPIELPSDEEIEKEAYWLINDDVNISFKEGAKWMKNQILNQKK